MIYITLINPLYEQCRDCIKSAGDQLCGVLVEDNMLDFVTSYGAD